MSESPCEGLRQVPGFLCRAALRNGAVFPSQVAAPKPCVPWVFVSCVLRDVTKETCGRLHSEVSEGHKEATAATERNSGGCPGVGGWGWPAAAVAEARPGDAAGNGPRRTPLGHRYCL